MSGRAKFVEAPMRPAKFAFGRRNIADTTFVRQLPVSGSLGAPTHSVCDAVLKFVRGADRVDR
jgi:hypothetical protein